MELLVTSDFDVPPERVWEVFFSDAFEAKLAAESGMLKTVFEEREEEGVRQRKTRVERQKPLPKMVAKVLGAEKLTYIQTDRFHPARSLLEWEVEIPSLGSRVSVRGTTVVTATASGSRRVQRGEIEVRVKLVGKTIEKAVAGDFEKTATRACEIARSLL